MSSQPTPAKEDIVPQSKKRRTKSSRADLILPVHRFQRKFINEKYGCKIGVSASVYFTAVIEYLCLEVLEGAQIESAKSKKRRRIIPKDIAISVSQDDELRELLKHVVFPEGGVLPLIHKELLQKKNQT